MGNLCLAWIQTQKEDQASLARSFFFQEYAFLVVKVKEHRPNREGDGDVYHLPTTIEHNTLLAGQGDAPNTNCQICHPIVQELNNVPTGKSNVSVQNVRYVGFPSQCSRASCIRYLHMFDQRQLSISEDQSSCSIHMHHPT